MKRSLRDLGLAEFNPCVNFIGSLFYGLHVSIQIGKVSLPKRKKPAFTKTFNVCRLVSLIILPKKGR